MKKIKVMKLKNLFVTLGASLALGVGALVAVNVHEDVKEVKAEGAAGRVSVDLTGEDWANNGEGQNISVYFWDDNEHTGWGSYTYAAYQEYVVFIDYELGFTPTGMKAVRYSNWYAESDWATDPWCTGEGHSWGKWNESDNLTFVENGNIVVAGSGYCFVGGAYLHGKPYNSDWDTWGNILDLNNVKLNGSKHVEYYATKSFVEWEEFGAKLFNDTWVTAFSLSDTIAAGSFVPKDDGEVGVANIVCKIPGTYAVYFDRNAGSLYFTDPNYAAADEWAVQFLGSSCTDTKNAWAVNGASYNLLSEESKALFINAEHIDYSETATGYINQAMQRYDYVLELYGTKTYSDFVGRVEAGKVTPASSLMGTTLENSSNVAIIIVASTLIVTSFAVILIVRKKRHSK